MIGTDEFKNGVTLKVEGGIYQIVEFQHVKPGKGGAFVRTKLRNLLNKNILERTFRSGEKFEEAFIEELKVQYMYEDGQAYHFMTQETYEQYTIDKGSIPEDITKFLKENMDVAILFFEHKPIEVKLPIFVELRVEHTETGLKGDTAKSANKPAKIETGATVLVPLFVNTGDMIKIDTRTGNYVGRV